MELPELHHVIAPSKGIVYPPENPKAQWPSLKENSNTTVALNTPSRSKNECNGDDFIKFQIHSAEQLIYRLSATFLWQYTLHSNTHHHRNSFDFFTDWCNGTLFLAFWLHASVSSPWRPPNKLIWWPPHNDLFHLMFSMWHQSASVLSPFQVYIFTCSFQFYLKLLDNALPDIFVVRSKKRNTRDFGMNKSNHPMSSNGHPKPIANKARLCLFK